VGNLGAGNGPNTIRLVNSNGAAGYTADGNFDFGFVGEAEGVEVFIQATKVGSAPSVVFCVGFLDTCGTFRELVATAAVAATGNAYLLVSHHAVDKTNAAVNRMIRDSMRVVADHSNTDIMDYTIEVTAV
jgi:hypothetical protein